VSELNRREFIKGLAAGGAVLGLGGIMVHKPLEALASGKYDIGQCKSVRVKCIAGRPNDGGRGAKDQSMGHPLGS